MSEPTGAVDVPPDVPPEEALDEVPEEALDEVPEEAPEHVVDDAPQPDFDPLAVLGADIPQPDHDAADAARAAVARLGLPPGSRPAPDAGTDDAPEPDAADTDAADRVLRSLGRLGSLACWWASVRGDAAAGPPGPVLMVGADPRTADRRPGARAVPLPGPARPGGADGDPEDAVAAAIAWGRTTADEAADRGVHLVVLCVDDPAATRALGADLLGLDAVEATGWPQNRGLGDAAWMAEVAALRDRMRSLRGLRDRPTAAVQALRAPATAGAVGLLLQAMVRRTPVLLDGPGAAAVALVGRRLSYLVSDWAQAAQQTTDPAHERALASLGLEPLTRLDVTREDGTAALVALAILDQAAALLEPPA